MVQHFSKLALFIVAVLSFGLASAASAEIIFEGYYVIKTGSKSIGYTVQRYEFDAAKKQFTSTSYLQTDPKNVDLTESLKAVSDDKFQPISYQYITKKSGVAKMIDAKFIKDEMVATVTNGKTEQTVKIKIKKGTFLSTFLGYLMLQNGYKADKRFIYSAIAEEDGAAYSGESFIKGEEDYNGKKVFKINNTFKGAQFTSYVTSKGEVLGTSSTPQNIATELVANAADATAGFTVPAETMKLLFGGMPTGKINIYNSKAPSVPISPTLTEAMTKVPVGKESAKTKTKSEPHIK